MDGKPDQPHNPERDERYNDDGRRWVGNFGAPGIISVGGTGSYSKADGSNATETVARGRGGLAQVASEIGNSDLVLFVDDFHYMLRELQADVAKQLKAAAELGIKSCVATVPHRSDDVVRANPELRGRVKAIDMEYWTNGELAKIGLEGFPHLNVVVDPEFIGRLAVESRAGHRSSCRLSACRHALH